MISFTVRISFNHEDRAEIAEILRELTQASRQEAGLRKLYPPPGAGRAVHCTDLRAVSPTSKPKRRTGSRRTLRNMRSEASTRKCSSESAKT